MSEEALKAEIASLRETNRRLNRRANQEDAYWMGRAMKAEAELKYISDHRFSEFQRVLNAHNELKLCYIAAVGKKPSEIKFHSVMDWTFDKGQDHKRTYANVMINGGGVYSERVVDAVRKAVGYTYGDGS